jgi:hypothetical protein
MLALQSLLYVLSLFVQSSKKRLGVVPGPYHLALEQVLWGSGSGSDA